MENKFINDAPFVEKLVGFWQDYPCLYDIRSSDFKDRHKGERAMSEIVEKLEQNSELSRPFGRTCLFAV